MVIIVYTLGDSPTCVLTCPFKETVKLCLSISYILYQSIVSDTELVVVGYLTGEFFTPISILRNVNSPNMSLSCEVDAC
jgi:hypothetical protein